MRKSKGRVIVHTGDGKGKTTAALGMALACFGTGLPGVVRPVHQGLLAGRARSSGCPSCRAWSIVAGRGFTIPQYRKKPWPEHLEAVAEAWALVRERVAAGGYDVVILDEINYVLSNPRLSEALPLEEVLAFLREKPPALHVVLTGRDAPAGLIECADTVTEMRAVKHAYRDQGIPAQRGIEY